MHGDEPFVMASAMCGFVAIATSSFPRQGMAQAPAYSPPPGQMAYPTPSQPSNNRALWIILGVVGALLVLCVLGCILLFLLGAFTGGTSSSSFATAVPTITR